jgi:hypothetical protein
MLFQRLLGAAQDVPTHTDADTTHANAAHANAAHANARPRL